MLFATLLFIQQLTCWFMTHRYLFFDWICLFSWYKHATRLLFIYIYQLLLLFVPKKNKYITVFFLETNELETQCIHHKSFVFNVSSKMKIAKRKPKAFIFFSIFSFRQSGRTINMNRNSILIALAVIVSHCLTSDHSTSNRLSVRSVLNFRCKVPINWI